MELERPDHLSSLAEAALEEIKKGQSEGRPIDKEFVEQASAFLHEQWLQKNADSGISEEKNRAYGDLSEEHKEQYRIVLARAGEALDREE